MKQNLDLNRTRLVSPPIQYKTTPGSQTWPFVSFNIPPGTLADVTDLARRLGQSRSSLLLEIVEQVGLRYARNVLSNMQPEDSEDHVAEQS